jgi:hypothetical protein
MEKVLIEEMSGNRNGATNISRKTLSRKMPLIVTNAIENIWTVLQNQEEAVIKKSRVEEQPSTLCRNLL